MCIEQVVKRVMLGRIKKKELYNVYREKRSVIRHKGIHLIGIFKLPGHSSC